MSLCLSPQQRRIYDRLKASANEEVSIAQLWPLLGTTKAAYRTSPRSRVMFCIGSMRYQLRIQGEEIHITPSGFLLSVPPQPSAGASASA